MDFEEEDDDLFDTESDASDYEYTDEDDEDMPWGVEGFTIGIVRVPTVLLQSTTALLLCQRPEDRPIMGESLQHAWMGGCAQVPGHPFGRASIERSLPGTSMASGEGVQGGVRILPGDDLQIRSTVILAVLAESRHPW
jgi:hypothetical protein